MHFEQFYLGCLAHASYLIGSAGEAAVVDPQRDVEQYLAEAAARDLKIKYVIETHLHADFVSGHAELAARTGATVVFGSRAAATLPHLAVCDGDELQVGRITIRVIETPGHTPESISLLVTDGDAPGAPAKLLTGDTLFVGDVGRPDLVGADGYTPQAMAGMLYDSLRDKIMELEDRTEVYPAHGAGSLCGRNISAEKSSTIGEQRRTNYALRDMTKDEFARLMTSNLPEIPRYFPFDRRINRGGAPALAALPAPPPLSPAEVARLACADGDAAHVLLDVRDAARFGAGHVPGALNVGLQGQFATWAGALIPPEKSIILVAETYEQIGEAAMRLARVGWERVAGYLEGGTDAWRAAGFEITTLPQASVHELRLALDRASGDARARPQVLDVRRPGEYANGHIRGALSVSLAKLDEDCCRLDPSRPAYVVCAGGYRSSAAASLLARRGFRDLRNVTGGMNAWIEADHPIETS